MAQEQKNAELELWNNEGCPFGQRAWWTILYKKIPADKVTIHWETDLSKKSEGFKAAYKQALFANPEKEGTTPTILHNGHYITESDVCAKYIDKAFDGPSVIPSDPYNELIVDMMVKNHFMACLGGMFGVVKGDDLKGEKLLAALQALDKAMAAQSKEGFLLGKDFSLFEILVFPVFYRFETVEALRGVPLLSKWLNKDSGCDEAKSIPRVISWFNTVNAMESVTEMKKTATLEFMKGALGHYMKK